MPVRFRPVRADRPVIFRHSFFSLNTLADYLQWVLARSCAVKMFRRLPAVTFFAGSAIAMRDDSLLININLLII